MVAICLQLENESRDSTHFANPLHHPALQGLRKPLQDYVEQHPERAAALLRQPRRISIPRLAWRQEFTILETLQPGYGLAEGMLLRNSTSFRATFHVADVTQFTCTFATDLIRELLVRGEGQPVTRWELGRLRLYLTLECRYLKGCDIVWAPVRSPAVIDDDEEDDAGSLSAGAEMGNWDTENADQGPTNALPKTRSALLAFTTECSVCRVGGCCQHWQAPLSTQ
jgi:hypothetical protein